MMDPLSNAFLDPALEAAWHEHFAKKNAGYLQAGVLFLPALFVLSGAADPLMPGADVARLWAVRFGLVVPALLAFTPLFFLRRFEALRARWLQEVMLGLGVVAVLGLNSLGALGIDGGQATLQAGIMGQLLALAFLYSFSRLRTIYAAFLGVFGSLISLAVLLPHWARNPELSSSAVFYGLMMNLIGIWVCRSIERLARDDFARGEELRLAEQRSDNLLRNALPETIAARLRGAERSSFAERHAEVTVIVADVVGFTALSERLPLDELGRLFDRVFSSFDELCARHGVEKIKTLGDGWLACAGAPVGRHHHADAVADLALAMIAVMAEAPLVGGERVGLRIGVATGPVVAGVIGHTRFAYDLWGEAVTEAVRMEQGGAVGRARVSAATAERIPARITWHGDAAWLSPAPIPGVPPLG